MKKEEFVQMGLTYRFALLQEKGKKLATLHYPQWLVHLYALGDFYVELRLDPERYTVLSAEVFDETHPRYAKHMNRMEGLETGYRFMPLAPCWALRTRMGFGQ